MNPPSCDCEAWTHVTKKRRDNVVIVVRQCNWCGRSLGAEKRDKFDLSKLAEFDESKIDKFNAKVDAWRAEQQRLFKLKQNDWFVEYSKYLNSEHWRKLRQLVIARDPICQRCFINRSQQAHHVSYEGYKKFGFSFAVECAGLCTPCHDLIHGRDAL